MLANHLVVRCGFSREPSTGLGWIPRVCRIIDWFACTPIFLRCWIHHRSNVISTSGPRFVV